MSHQTRNRVLAWITALVLVPAVLLFLFGVLAANSPAQRAKNDRFLRTQLLPLADFVIAFRDENKRLPTRQEFHDRMIGESNRAVEYYSTKPSDLWFWGTEEVDFIVGAWRGEWMEYYQSWDGVVFTRDDRPLSHAESER